MGKSKIIYIIFCRKLKTSLKNELYLLSHAKLSEYWKENIITTIFFMYKDKEKKFPVGVVFNPEEFIPQYLKRFLLRQELEGKPLSPGHYEVLFKVCCNIMAEVLLYCSKYMRPCMK